MVDEAIGRRERQARQTRAEILTAARRLFADRGYARTSVRDVAKAAGVSTQTVYDSIGSKHALVTQLNDLIDEEADIRAIVEESLASVDADRLAATQARITRSILEHCGDILHALLTGAAAEPELAAVLEEGHRRHVDGARQIVAALQRSDALDDSVAVDDAAETMAALADVRFAVVLRDTYGWSLDRIEDWIGASIGRLLLR